MSVVLGVGVFYVLEGSQQQGQTFVMMLVVALGGHGGQNTQKAEIKICGAPLLRNQPETPRQQRLKLLRTHRRVE